MSCSWVLAKSVSVVTMNIGWQDHQYLTREMVKQMPFTLQHFLPQRICLIDKLTNRTCNGLDPDWG